MTTPDKEEMPKKDRTPVLPVHLEQPWAGFSCLHIGSFKIGIVVTDEDCTQDPDAAGAALEEWVTACNAYEPMREALSKIANCGQSQEPDHWQFRIMARDTSNAALSTLPVNERQTSDDVGILRDALADLCDEIDRHIDAALDDRKPVFKGIVAARAALKGVPQPATPKEAAMTEAQIKHMVDRFLMWKLPEHFNPDGGISFEPFGSKGTPHEYRRDPVGTNLLSAEQATAMVRHMLEGVPQPASDDYQADAGAPAMSEKVNARSEWLPIETAPKDGTEILAWRDDCGTLLVRWTSAYELLTDAEAEASGMDENALHFESWFCADFIQGCRLENETVPTHWMPLPSPPGAELNFSNEAERDGVSLKPDTSSQPASEAGKLSTDEVQE